MNKALYKNTTHKNAPHDNTSMTTKIGDRTINQLVQAINRFLSIGQTHFTLMNKPFFLEHAYGEKWQLSGPDGHVCWLEKGPCGSFVPA